MRIGSKTVTPLLVAILGSASLPALAVVPSFTYTIRVTVRVGGGGWISTPHSAHYRGVVEGDGSGFVEDEADESEPQEVLSVLDIAHRLMGGDYSESFSVGPCDRRVAYSPESLREAAVEAYEMHLEDFPTDWYSMRESAVALLVNGEFEPGLARLIQSYAGDEAMARIPLDASLLGENPAPMTKLLTTMSRYAKVNDSGAAWLAVTMVLQARGDAPHALKTLERAEAAGLDQGLVDPMRAALGELQTP